MLDLDTKIKLDQDAIDSPNLCDRFSEEDLKKIGDWCYNGYRLDRQSREKWERRNEAGMNLAMQITQAKNFPWPNCANIAFPLVTIAVLQFHATAYPAIIPSTDVVKCRVIGPDPAGEKLKRCQRISTHMSYQVLEEDEDWEEQHDRLLINIGCVGTAFKKSYYGSEGYNESDLVMAKDLVIDYFAKSVEKAPRKTHIIPMFRNDIYERVMRGTFRNVLEEEWFKSIQIPKQTQPEVSKDKRHGQTPPAEPDETTPFILLEQHCSLDLDGDGYAEPYIVTFDENSKSVVRITVRFRRMEDIERDDRKKIICIRAQEYFTKYGFIPSPDGGIYDIGFGILLGPLNESANTAINQLFDAGTMSTTAGGFLGRGAKIRGGVYYFSPFQWNRVDGGGDDLQKNLIPLPVREPSAVLFQLLSLIVNYTNRISGSTDVMVGENPGQNTPAETSRTMVQMGMKIYSAIFKRVWRSMKDEFKKLYILNSIYLPAVGSYGSQGAKISREDYTDDPRAVCPAADPNISSDAEAFMRATALKQAAMTTQGYDLEAVERNYLKALRVPDIEIIYKGPGNVPPLPNYKLEVEKLKNSTKQLAVKSDMQKFAFEMIEIHRLNSAKIVELEAKAIKLVEEAGGVKTEQMIQAFNAAIGALKTHNDVLSKRIELLLKGMEMDNERASAGAGAGDQGGSMEGMAGASGDKGNVIPMPQMAAGGA